MTDNIHRYRICRPESDAYYPVDPVNPRCWKIRDFWAASIYTEGRFLISALHWTQKGCQDEILRIIGYYENKETENETS